MKRPGHLKTRTKIVCTIGPVTGSSSVMERLIRSGMNVARLNLSHGTTDLHTRYVQTVRRISQRLNRPVSILIDLPGPKYRIGRLAGGQVALKKRSRLTLTVADIEGNASLVPVNLPNLSRDVKVGDIVLIDDGAIQLRVLVKSNSEVTCRVIVGGVLIERRGLVVPGMHISGPYLTEMLHNYILYAIREKPDYLAISFVSSADDVLAVKSVLKENEENIPIISKIERGQAVRDFDKILAVSDGIMVARGDLGVDIPLEKIPLIQKDIIQKCNRAGKPVITATQMLESMVNAARPTRAEVTDIANAIFDGTDAIMLSAETSIGKYPVKSVKTMAKVAAETEKKLPYEQYIAQRSGWIERETDELISYSACYTAGSLGAAAIVAFTHSGSTARRVAKYRPRVPILAITSGEAVSGQLLLHWGVYPFYVAEASSLDELFTTGARLVKELGLAKSGDLIVITGGVPVGQAGSTNLLKVEVIG
jgi:pyruvate kinase